MALISASLINTLNDNVDRTSYSFPSVSPVGGKLYLLVISSNTSTQPTVTGGGMSGWNLVIDQSNILGNNNLRIFRALQSSPGSGGITINFGGVTQTFCAAQLVEFSNVDTSGTNGSGAIVQTAGGTLLSAGTSITVGLGTFGKASNATFGAFKIGVNEVITNGTGFTQVSEIGTTNPDARLDSQFRNNNDTSVDWSWTTSNANVAAAAVEIAATPYPRIIVV